MSIPIEELQNVCENVRSAAQYIYEEKKISYLCITEFPRGWCGCLSRVLGVLLSREYPEEKFYYVCGEAVLAEKKWTSHAWIRYEDLILDITADQFVEVTESIIINAVSSSFFHAKFEITDEHLVDNNAGSYYEEGIILNKVYELRNNKDLV